MNGLHVTAISGTSASLATLIVWLSNALGGGQWFPVDSGTAIALANLLVAIVGAGGLAAWRKTLGASSPPS